MSNGTIAYPFVFPEMTSENVSIVFAILSSVIFGWRTVGHASSGSDHRRPPGKIIGL